MTPSDTLRLFTAVGLPEAVREQAREQTTGIQCSLGSLRWVPVERWHVTLLFLAEAPARDLPELKARLSRATSRHPPLQLRLAAGGRFDGRVLWLGVEGDRDQLRVLARSHRAAARRMDLGQETTRYRPHVTVARSSRPVDLRPVVAELATVMSASWQVTEALLVRSDLHPKPTYTVVDRWPLRPGSGQGGDHDDHDEQRQSEEDDPPSRAGVHQA